MQKKGQGGWLTSDLQARVGEPLHLRLVSDDVVHSFALGQSDFEPVDVLPGKPTEVTLTFDDPGTYTFYCTRWCGADHWCIRGTVTVASDQYADQTLPDPLLYLQLGIDLDAPHELHDFELNGLPSDEKGAALEVTLPPEFLTSRTLPRSHALPDLRRPEFRAGYGQSERGSSLGFGRLDLGTEYKSYSAGRR